MIFVLLKETFLDRNNDYYLIINNLSRFCVKSMFLHPFPFCYTLSFEIFNLMLN